ncbi:hypothetical protein L195_g064272, partial [Trifolium pratense]
LLQKLLIRSCSSRSCSSEVAPSEVAHQKLLLITASDNFRTF